MNGDGEKSHQAPTGPAAVPADIEPCPNAAVPHGLRRQRPRRPGLVVRLELARVSVTI